MSIADQLRKIAAQLEADTGAHEYDAEGVGAPDQHGLVRLRGLDELRTSVPAEYQHAIPQRVACEPGRRKLQAALDAAEPGSEEFRRLTALVYITGERIKAAGAAAGGIGRFDEMHPAVFTRTEAPDTAPIHQQWRRTAERIQDARGVPGHLLTPAGVVSWFAAEQSKREEMDRDGRAQARHGSTWRL